MRSIVLSPGQNLRQCTEQFATGELKGRRRVTEALSAEEQLMLDLMKYMAATEGKIPPAGSGAPPNVKAVRVDRLAATVAKRSPWAASR